jgi:hypothetical protein
VFVVVVHRLGSSGQVQFLVILDSVAMRRIRTVVVRP